MTLSRGLAPQVSPSALVIPTKPQAALGLAARPGGLMSSFLVQELPHLVQTLLIDDLPPRSKSLSLQPDEPGVGGRAAQWPPSDSDCQPAVQIVPTSNMP